MKDIKQFIRFPQGDNEVLIDPEKVSHIKKEKVPAYALKERAGKTVVYVLFGGTNEWVEFFDKDAELVWHYFYNYGLAKPATLD